MQETISLHEIKHALSLRLQVPDLNVKGCSADIHINIDNDNICWEGQAGDVRLTARCTPAGQELWHIDMSLTNSGADAEVRVAYPYLFYHIDQEQQVRAFDPTFGGVLEVFKHPLDNHYPGPASYCLMAASGEESTVAVGVFDTEQRNIRLRHIPAGVEGHIRFLIERVLIKQNETITLPRQFIKIGDDWAAAMAPYRDWLQNNFTRKRQQPDWWVNGNFTETRKAHCIAPWFPPDAVAGVWIFNDLGRPRTFEDVKKEVDEAVRMGDEEGFTPIFFQFGWWKNMAELRGMFMFDSLCGDYTEAHDLTRRVVDYIHERGARTFLYTNMIAIGDETKVFKTQPELLICDGAGFPVYNSGYPMLMLCPGAPGIKEYWNKVIDYILKDMDADGIFFDQACGGFPPQYCYAAGHNHAHPDTYGQDFLALMDYTGSRMREIKPDSIIVAELYHDTRALMLDVSDGYGYSGIRTKTPETRDAQISTQPAEYFIFSRFLCPDTYCQRQSSDEKLMNGAMGSPSSPIWREYKDVFEAGVRPYKVKPYGAIAYLFGPDEKRVILAVRANGAIGQAHIALPAGIEITGELPAGLAMQPDGRLMCQTTATPVYYPLMLAD
ncbi:MAG: DUF6259 domain-containing protein [bacterium]